MLNGYIRHKKINILIKKYHFLIDKFWKNSYNMCAKEVMDVNLKELKIKMIRYDDSTKSLAEFLGITPLTLSRKLSGHSEFTLSESVKLKNRYDLTDEEYFQIFSTEVTT